MTGTCTPSTRSHNRPSPEQSVPGRFLGAGPAARWLSPALPRRTDADPLDHGLLASGNLGLVPAGDRRRDDDQHSCDEDRHDPTDPVNPGTAVSTESGVDEPADDHSADAAEN